MWNIQPIPLHFAGHKTPMPYKNQHSKDPGAPPPAQVRIWSRAKFSSSLLGTGLGMNTHSILADKLPGERH